MATENTAGYLGAPLITPAAESIFTSSAADTDLAPIVWSVLCFGNGLLVVAIGSPSIRFNLL